MTDRMEKILGATIQHGDLSRRIYLMKTGGADPAQLVEALLKLAEEKSYTKIFAKVPETEAGPFMAEGFECEAKIPGFYFSEGGEAAFFLGKFLSADRREESEADKLDEVCSLAQSRAKDSFDAELPDQFTLRECKESDAEEMAEIYKKVFPSYPFPIFDPEYLRETMRTHIRYFGVEEGGKLIALSSAETYREYGAAEMTDFATLPEKRGSSLGSFLLLQMEQAMQEEKIGCAYTIARAVSPGMNITFARLGYAFGGRLKNNTNISGSIESMNVWFKNLFQED